MTSDDLGRVAVIFGCSYEIAALVSKWTPGDFELPTISELCWRGTEDPRLRGLVWAAGGFANWHIFVRPQSPVSITQETK